MSGGVDRRFGGVSHKIRRRDFNVNNEPNSSDDDASSTGSGAQIELPAPRPMRRKNALRYSFGKSAKEIRVGDIMSALDQLEVAANNEGRPLNDEAQEKEPPAPRGAYFEPGSESDEDKSKDGDKGTSEEKAQSKVEEKDDDDDDDKDSTKDEEDVDKDEEEEDKSDSSSSTSSSSSEESADGGDNEEEVKAKRQEQQSKAAEKALLKSLAALPPSPLVAELLTVPLPSASSLSSFEEGVALRPATASTAVTGASASAPAPAAGPPSNDPALTPAQLAARAKWIDAVVRFLRIRGSLMNAWVTLGLPSWEDADLPEPNYAPTKEQQPFATIGDVSSVAAFSLSLLLSFSPSFLLSLPPHSLSLSPSPPFGVGVPRRRPRQARLRRSNDGPGDAMAHKHRG